MRASFRGNRQCSREHFDRFVSPSYHSKGRTRPTPRGETPTAYIPSRSRSIVRSVPITDDDIRRFQAIWREEFEEDITADEARAHIGRLDALYLMLLRPLPEESRDTQNP